MLSEVSHILTLQGKGSETGVLSRVPLMVFGVTGKFVAPGNNRHSGVYAVVYANKQATSNVRSI